MAVFQNLLVAYDGSSHSKKALERAVELMDANPRVKTHIVNVVHSPHMDLYSLYGPTLSQDMLRELDEAAEQTLSEAKEIVVDYEQACHFNRLRGKAQQKIIEYADEHEVDLIILGSRGLGAFKGMLLGSVSNHVIQHATCDVLVIK